MTTEYLFVYGTLRRECRVGMGHLLSGGCEFYAVGSLQGRLYEVAGYPGVVPSHDPRDRVLGDIFRIDARIGERRDLWNRLDHYEGCGAGFPEPQEYVRQLLPIREADGGQVLAWTYLYNRPEAGLQYIPSGDYLRFLAEENNQAPAGTDS